MKPKLITYILDNGDEAIAIFAANNDAETTRRYLEAISDPNYDATPSKIPTPRESSLSQRVFAAIGSEWMSIETLMGRFSSQNKRSMSVLLARLKRAKKIENVKMFKTWYYRRIEDV